MDLRQLQPYIIGWIRDYLSQALAGVISVFHLVVHELTVTRVYGDLATVPLTDYSALSSIVGWSSTDAQQIYYKKIGRQVKVTFFIQGTSNSPQVSFTLPFTNAEGLIQVPCRVIDNGVLQLDPGYLNLSAGSNTVVIRKNMQDAAFTASGQKIVLGQFALEATQ